MRTEADIKESIDTDTAACVEAKKRGKFLGGFFVPRKALEPECRQEATAKYAAELQQAQQREYDVQLGTDAALMSKLAGNSNIYPLLATILITVIILAIILY